MEGIWSAKVGPFESTFERRRRTAYTSWSTVFCHLPDSSSHKPTMTVDAPPCSFAHCSSHNRVVIGHRSTMRKDDSLNSRICRYSRSRGKGRPHDHLRLGLTFDITFCGRTRFRSWLRLLCEAALGSFLILGSVGGVVRSLLDFHSGNLAYHLGQLVGTVLLLAFGVFLLRDSIKVGARLRSTEPIVPQ